MPRNPYIGKRPGRNTYAAHRQLIELAKTMDMKGIMIRPAHVEIQSGDGKTAGD
jgi:hypothetical protein